MSDVTTGLEIQGRTSRPQAARRQACRHDCCACVHDFEQTQQTAEQLRVELLHEQAENTRLWLEAREAIRRILFDLIPQRRISGMPGETEGFHQGWDQCREEMERRVQELVKAI